MDFDAAITAHSDWKMKLRGYINKPDGSLKAEVVGQDNQCALGKWIYGEGKTYSQMPEYSDLKTLHAQFHQCASDVIKKADTKQPQAAEAMIASGSEYVNISNKVITAIRTMRGKAQQAA